MKTILGIVICFFSVASFAIEPNAINVQGGIGIYGSRGLVGFSVDKFYLSNHALSVSLGVDIVGATAAGGYKYFTDKLNTSDSVWNKCFFVFECDSHMYVGPSLQYANATKSKITENGLVREYETAPKVLGLVSVGFRTIYKNNLTVDAEFSYRTIVSGGKSTQVTGAAEDDRDLLELGYRSAGVNFAIGYIF